MTCSLSIDYLTKPLGVLRSVHESLKPGGLAVVAFSDRMFRSKAVEIWRDAPDHSTRLWLVAAYFHYSLAAGGGAGARAGARAGTIATGVPLPGDAWQDLTVLDLSPGGGGGDPLFVVQAWKKK